MCGVWQRYNALATDGDTGSASSARVFTILISALKRLVTSRPAMLGVSAQMCGVGVPAGDKRTVLATTTWTVSRRWWRRQPARRCRTLLG
jgi:hypothetical protein